MKATVEFGLNEATRAKDRVGFDEVSNFIYTQLFKMRKELRFDLMGQYPDVKWDTPSIKKRGDKIMVRVDGDFPEGRDAKGEGGEGYVEFEIVLR